MQSNQDGWLVSRCLFLAVVALALAASPAGSAPTVIKPDFRVDQDTTGSNASLPFVAASDAGDFVVAWHDTRSNEHSYARQFDAAGNPVTNEFRIDPVEAGVEGEYPNVAIRRDGQAAYFVYERHTASGSNVVVRRYVMATHAFDPGYVQVDVGNIARSGTLAIDPGTGNVAVSWFNAPEPHQLYFREFTPTLTPLCNPIPMQHPGLGGAGHGVFPGATKANAYVAALGQREYLLAWSEDRPGYNPMGEFPVLAAPYAQRVSASGTIGNAFPVAQESIYTEPPASGWGLANYLHVAGSPSGDVLVNWTNFPYHIYARRLNRLGQPLGNEMRVDAESAGNALNSYATSDPSSIFTVVWRDNVTNADALAETKTQVFARRFDPLQDEFRVDAGPTDNFVEHPDLSASAGTIVYAWEDRRPDGHSGDGDIYVKILQNLKKDDFRVDQAASGAVASRPFVGAANAGNFVITWHDERAGEHAYARQFDATGTPVANEFRIDPVESGVEGEYPHVAMRRDGTSAQFVYERADALGTHVMTRQYLPSSQTFAGSPVQVDTGTPYAVFPNVAIDPGTGNVGVVWTNEGTPNLRQVYFREVTPAGVPLGTPVALEHPGVASGGTGTYNKQYVYVAALGAGKYLVAWSEHNPGAGIVSETRAQRVTAAGTLGPSFAVAQASIYDPNVTPLGLAAYVSAREAPNGDALISWTAYPYHIWARRYNSAGTALGNEMRIDTGDPAFQARKSYVSSDPSGVFTISWEDNVHSGFIDDTETTVSARRFNSAFVEFRVDSGPAGNYIEHPDVGATTSSLIFAWEDRRPDGFGGDGDIFAKIISNPPGGCFSLARTATPEEARTALGALLLPLLVGLTVVIWGRVRRPKARRSA